MIKLSKKKYIGLGHVPMGIGAVIKGWDMAEEDFRNPSRLPVVNFRAMTEACPHNCFHCFTDKNKKILTLNEIKDVIDQLADLNTYAIDFVGEGEPTVDKDFFEIIEYASSKGIHQSIYTDAAVKMRDKDFVKRVYESGASVCPKCDSLFNEEYQNWVVGDKTGKYFKQRNEAIKLLIDYGFNRVQEDGTTRLGFDMVVTKRNIDEIEKTLRYCRDNNLWIIFTTYLPSGRSGREDFNRSLILNEGDRTKLKEIVKKIDEEYEFFHPIWNGSTTMPCIEFLQIYGDGRVSPCVGNENIVGNIRESSIKKLENKILKKYPFLNRAKFDGYCPYRPKI
ncbi:radical SAM protein [Patescibacteria group bacterium]|nr:radical SAM protein [Patescibacteria group bacterium]MBU4367577.1 radical SAM protein [Patescibacteria group bacterium]MBU4461618.1 radical SAM protein [Patescibacteria group bacterium]MCG2699515.1 radical SAM protein [Candidatus Parcubacteria bacterium]